MSYRGTDMGRLPPPVLILSAALACALAMAACSPREPADEDRKVVDAPIESIDILVRESFPPGYTAHIVSGLPSGCARFNMAAVIERTGNNIYISVTNTVPADPNVACTDIYGYHETNLDLGQNFRPGVTYTVQVNDKRTTFTAQ